MVYLLVSIHISDILVLCVTGPHHVPGIRLLNQLEAAIFECIDYCVVDVCCIINPKGEEKMLYRVQRVLSDPIRGALLLGVLRIGEERCGRALIENGFQEINLVCMRLEDTVGKAALLLLYECLLQRVVDKELGHLLLRVVALHVGKLLKSQSLL